MKPEYKTKVISLLEGIAMRNRVIIDMLEGRIPSDQKRATDLSREIKLLLEQIENYIDIS